MLVRHASLFGVAAFFCVTSAVADPIDSVVAQCGGPLWLNGAYPVLHLPPDAGTDKVTAKVFAMTGYLSGKGANFQILKKRQVQIPGGPSDTYTAVLIRTGSQEAVVLLQCEGNDWWSRLITVNSSGMPDQL
jgi:hypothetical protein